MSAEGSAGHSLGSKQLYSQGWNEHQCWKGGYKLKSDYQFILCLNKLWEEPKMPRWLGLQLLGFHCLCDSDHTAVSWHLTEVLKHIRSLLGLNDNRNHPNSKGNYLSVTFHKVVSFPSGFYAANDISNQPGSLPSPQSIVGIWMSWN